MDWITSFHEEIEHYWMETNVIYFGYNNKSRMLIYLECEPCEYGSVEVVYTIRAGLDIKKEDLKHFPPLFVYNFNLEVVKSFQEHKGETQDPWWCSVFEKKSLEEVLELVVQLKEYFADYYLHSIPDFLIEV